MDLEERVKARTQQLADREATLRALVANLHDVVFVFDAAGKLLDVGGNYMGITGYVRQELLNCSPEEFWGMFLVAEDRVRIREDLTRAAQSLSSAHCRVRLCDRAGEVRWCDLVLVPLRDDQERFLGTQGIVSDIGERVQTERIIHSLNQAAEVVQRASLSLSGVLEAVSAELTALGMHSAIFLPGLGPGGTLLVHLGGDKDIVEGARRLMAHSCDAGHEPLTRAKPLICALKQGKTVAFELDEAFYAQASGNRDLAQSLRWRLPPLSALAMPLLADDRVFGLLCVADKVINPSLQPAIEVFANQTAIAIRNAQLLTQVSESEEQYRSVFEAARDGFLVLTASGRVAEANPAACAMLGYAREALLAVGFDSLFAFERFIDAQQFAEKVEADGYCESAADGVRQDGEHFAVEVRGTPLVFRGEMHLLVVVTDITERVKAQEALLHSERLRALGLMAGGIAHDFNNMLMGIQGFAEEAKSSFRIDPAQAEDDMARIVASAQVAAAAVSRLQSLYRDADDLSDLAPVQLDDLVTAALDVTQAHWKDTPQAEGRTIHVEKALSHPPNIKGNASELRRVLINLVINAVQAMPNGGTLSIKTGHEGAWSWATVSDTGVGITPEVRAHLFEPYFTTKKETGRGLGLALSQDIVKRHAGELTLESSPGQGTTFMMRLPTAQAVPSSSESEQRDSGAGLHVQGMHRVLVVDDEEPLRTLFSRFLERLGQVAVIATDGRIALDLLEHERFDLLITDLGMPDMSGRQVAQRARALCPGLPIILTTGWGETMTPEKLAEMRVAALLSKPFTFDELTATLEQTLRNKD
jgi:PAS domain S-box-containing protein